MATHGGGQLRLQHFDGYFAAVFEIVGKIDRRHTAAADLVLDPVMPAQRRLETFKLV